jgi:predicted kinase
MKLSLNDDQKNLIIETFAKHIKEREIMDRVELMQAIADDNNHEDTEWHEFARKIDEQKFVSPVVKRGKLRFLIGLQRSGKSTWATNWMRGTPREENGIIFPRAVVCADNIRLAITGERYNKLSEPTVFMVKDYMIEALLSRGNDVVCDGTHTTKTSIRRNFEIDINATWTLINTPRVVCVQRVIESEQLDLIAVLERSSKQLSMLLEEGLPEVCKQLKEEIQKRWTK